MKNRFFYGLNDLIFKADITDDRQGLSARFFDCARCCMNGTGELRVRQVCFGRNNNMGPVTRRPQSNSFADATASAA